MKIEVREGEAFGEFGANIVRAAVDDDVIGVLGIATGSSPGPIYASLRDHAPRRVRDVRMFALDEYVGLPASHPESYHAVVRREVAEPLDLDPSRVRVLDGQAADLEDECRAFEAEIRAVGGVDLQLLGIGSNGHIGFNEPGTPPSSRTRRTVLAASTRRDNARFFAHPEDVPLECLTQGIGTILEARRILLVARGGAKALAVQRAVEGPPDVAWPASWLIDHPDVTLLLDPAAASMLALSRRN